MFHLTAIIKKLKGLTQHWFPLAMMPIPDDPAAYPEPIGTSVPVSPTHRIRTWSTGRARPSR